MLKTAVDASENELHAVYVFGSLELRRTTYADGDYERTSATMAPYLGASGTRLARLYYGSEDLLTLSSGRLHVLLELPDHLGSSSVVIDKATSELVEATRYQAYGATESDYRPERWESYREEYKFTGKEEDIELGLVYFGARYYAPALNRWMSADPLAVHLPGEADLNVYAYVHGQALRRIDPLGLDWENPGPATEVTGDDGVRVTTMPADVIDGTRSGPGTAATHTVVTADDPAGAGRTTAAPAVAPTHLAAVPPPMWSWSVSKTVTVLEYFLVPGKMLADPLTDSGREIANASKQPGPITAAGVASGAAEGVAEQVEPPLLGAATGNALVRGAGDSIPAANDKLGPAVGKGIVRAAGTALLLRAMKGGSPPPVEKPSTLEPGPFAKESIPAHRGRPTSAEQQQVNALMKKHGCHTCGTKDPGTKSGNAIADHQPPQALGEPKDFCAHCNGCRLRPVGAVLQELNRRNQGE